MTNIELSGYMRVQKKTARRLYREGKTIYITPCNMHPDNYYAPAMPFSNRLKQDNDNGMYGNVASVFDKRVDAYAAYNCNAYTGRYPAFYIKH